MGAAEESRGFTLRLYASLTMEWLNSNAGAVQAISAMVVAALTACLLYATLKYVTLTQRMAKAAEASIEQMRTTFQVTHRPLVAIDISFDPLSAVHFIKYALSAVNTGNDEAVELIVEFGKPDDLFHILVAFGDLLPGQTRTITSTFAFGADLARSWLDEIQQCPAISLKFERRFSSRDGRTWKEQGTLMHDASKELVIKIQGFAKRGPQ